MDLMMSMDKSCTLRSPHRHVECEPRIVRVKEDREPELGPALCAPARRSLWAGIVHGSPSWLLDGSGF